MALLLVIVTVLFWLYRFQKSNEWNKVQAEILEVSVKAQRDRSKNISLINYSVDLKFKYTIEYKEYIGTNIYAGLPNVFTEKKDVEKFMQNNAVWNKVVAYYDDNNPADSALLRYNTPYLAIILIITAILWIWYGILQVNKLMWD